MLDNSIIYNAQSKEDRQKHEENCDAIISNLKDEHYSVDKGFSLIKSGQNIEKYIKLIDTKINAHDYRQADNICGFLLSQIHLDDKDANTLLQRAEVLMTKAEAMSASRLIKGDNRLIEECNYLQKPDAVAKNKERGINLLLKLFETDPVEAAKQFMGSVGSDGNNKSQVDTYDQVAKKNEGLTSLALVEAKKHILKNWPEHTDWLSHVDVLDQELKERKVLRNIDAGLYNNKEQKPDFREVTLRYVELACQEIKSIFRG